MTKANAKIFGRFWKELTIVEFMRREQKIPLSTWKAAQKGHPQSKGSKGG